MASAPFLVNIDLNNNQLENAKLHNVAGTPAAGYGKGSIYIDTTSGQDKPKWYDGAAWQTIYPFDTANTASTGVLRDASGNFSAGTITATFSGNLTGNVTGNVSGSSGSCTGNAATVTNGVYTNGSYSDPSWITSLAGSKISGNISGNAATATSATTAATCTGNSATVTVTQNQFLIGNGSNIGASTAKSSIPLSGFGAATADVDLGSKKIVNLADPTNAQDAATKAYVDAKAQGLDIKESCVAASTAALPSYVATGTAGTAGAYLEASANGTFPTEIQYISSPQVGDRVLVKNETSTLAKWNGIYTITAVGGALAKWKLTRATDFDAGTATSGSFVFIEQGSTLGGTGWVMTTSGTITINSTAITWTQFSGAGSYGANRGIVLDTSTNQFNFAQNSDYTAGRIPFAGATDALGTASTKIGFNSNFVWDNGNSRLGIGTASPSAKLHVNGAARIQSDLELSDSGDTTRGYIFGTNNGLTYRAISLPHIWQNNSSELLRLDTSGNLGLGVVPNAWGTGYKAIQLSGQGVSIFGSTATSYAGFTSNGFYNGSNWSYNNSAPAGLYIINQNSHVWYNAPSGTAGATQSVTQGQYYTVTTTGDTVLVDWQKRFSELTVLPTVGQQIYCTSTGTLLGTATVTQIVTFSTRMILDASGRVGIGTATPSVELEVGSGSGTKTIKISGATNILDIGYGTIRGGSNYGDVRILTDRFRIYKEDGTQIVKNINGTNGDETWYDGAGGTRMTLNSTGLGIGASPSYKLDVNSGQIRVVESGTGSGDGGLIAATASANGNAGVLLQTNGVSRWNLTTSGTNGANFRIYNYTLGSSVATFDSSGNVGIGVTPSAWGNAFRAIQMGSGTTTASFIAQTNSPVARIMTNSYYDGANFVKVSNNTAGMYVIQNNAHEWHTAGTGTGNFSFTQAMTLDASGNLGVGTSPAYNKLHIAGSNSTDGPTNFLCVLDNTASPVSGVGTGIAFKTNVGTFRAILGVVEAVKENSTSDNYASALKFSTRTNGSDLATRLTISSAGVATFSGTVTVKSNSGSGTGYAPAIYNATLSGDGSTTAFTVTHNFSNPKPIVQVWQKGSPYGLVYADITSNSTGTTTTITFATAPASGTDYWVTVLG